MDRRDEKLVSLQNDVFSRGLQSKEASHINSKRDKENAELRKRVEFLEKQQDSHIRQIEELKTDGFEVQKLEEVLARTSSKKHKRRSKKKSSKKGDSYLDELEEQYSDDDDQAELEKLRTNYQVILRTLGQKCENYIQLQTKFHKKEEEMADLQRQLDERALEATAPPASVPSASASVSNEDAARIIKDLEKRIEASNEICKKLFKSGRHWHGRAQTREKDLLRLRKELQQERTLREKLTDRNSRRGLAQSGNIVVPVFLRGKKQHSNEARIYESGTMDEFF